LRILPIELPLRPWPIVLITLRHRTLNSVAQRFIEHLRGHAKFVATNARAGQVAECTSSPTER